MNSVGDPGAAALLRAVMHNGAVFDRDIADGGKPGAETPIKDIVISNYIVEQPGVAAAHEDASA